MTLGRLLPRIIAALFILDGVGRSLPLDPLCFQAWECVTRYQEPGAIFEANRRFSSAETHGNLSNMGNLPGLRQTRPQTFTTDAFGFRNDPVLKDKAVDGIVLGDSFVAGYGNSDNETLPVQLSRQIGANFYNAGGPYAYLATARTMKSRLQLREPWAIVVWTENVPIPYFTQAEALALHPDQTTRVLDRLSSGRGQRVRSILRGWWYTSPLKIASEKAFLAVSDEVILPNRFAEKVVERRLSNGDPILFYPPDVVEFERHRESEPVTEHLKWLAAGLQAAGYRPLIVLAPSKYSVYHPLLDRPAPAAVDARHLLARVEEALRLEGLNVIDLTGVFRAQAADGLAARRYLYWLDDTHWNARGIGLVAKLIEQKLALEPTNHGKVSGDNGI